MQADDDPQLTAEHDGVVVTVVSTTWRAAIVEVRSGDDVRWVTVPRHELAGFMTAAATGAMGVALAACWARPARTQQAMWALISECSTHCLTRGCCSLPSARC